MLLSSYIGKDPLPAEPAAGLRLSKNSEIFRHRKGRSLRKKPIRGVFRFQSSHSSPGGFAPGPFPAARRRRNPRAPGNALPSITVARRDRRSAGRNGGGTGPGQREPQRGPQKGGRAHPCRRGAGGPPASQLQPPKRGRARAGQGLPAPPGAAETPPTTTQPPRGERPNRTAGGPQCSQARPPGLPRAWPGGLRPPRFGRRRKLTGADRRRPTAGPAPHHQAPTTTSPGGQSPAGGGPGKPGNFHAAAFLLVPRTAIRPPQGTRRGAIAPGRDGGAGHAARPGGTDGAEIRQKQGPSYGRGWGGAWPESLTPVFHRKSPVSVTKKGRSRSPSQISLIIPPRDTRFRLVRRSSR